MLIQAIVFVLRPTAVYQAIDLGVAAHWLGAIGASFAVVPLLLAVPTGHLADRFGERKVMVAGGLMTLTAAVTFVVAAGSVGGLLLATVLLGTGHLGSVVGQQALVANRTPHDGYDRAFGRYTFVASLGQALGPALIILVGGHRAIPDTHNIFLAAAVLCLPLLITAGLSPTPTPRDTFASEATAPGATRHLLRRRGLVHALIVSCVVLAAVDISLVYLPALGAERDIASGTVGLLLAVRAITSMASRLGLGWLSATVGRGRLLTGSVVLAAGAIAATPLPLPIWGLFVAVAVAGFGLGVGQPLTMSWLAEATPPGMRGRAMSLRLTGNRLGQVVVPSLAGLLAAGAGAGGVLWVTALALGAVAAVSHGIEHQVSNPQLSHRKQDP